MENELVRQKYFKDKSLKEVGKLIANAKKVYNEKNKSIKGFI